MIARLACLLLLASACSRTVKVVETAPDGPSTLYVNARIHTLDQGKTGQAMRVASGAIVEVFAAAPAARTGETVVDLEGATVVPGLIDAHGHLDMLGRQMMQLDLREARSAEEVAALVRERAATVPEGGWIIGFGWDQNLWEGKRFPDRAVLDKAAPAHKVWLYRISHAIWVNSAVLAAAGVDKTTANPQGGDILRRKNGEPTGVLVDNADTLVKSLLPESTLADRRAVFERAFEHVTKLGLTGVHSMMMTVADARALLSLEADRRVPIRVAAYVTDEWPAVEGLLATPPDRDGMVWLTGVKLFGDGALGSRSAALLAPYSDDAKSRGLTIHTTDELRGKTEQITAAGYQIAIHAIGDAANRQALDVLSPLVATAKRAPRIEHAQIVEKTDLARFATSGVVASIQPIHGPSDMLWAVERVGWDRLKGGSYAARSLIDSGATVALGSDFPIESANPWWGIHAAVTRQNAQGEPPDGFLPDQKITLAQALEHYCVTPHEVIGDGQPGTLRAGAPADFVVVAGDPFAATPGALRDVTVLRTVVAGCEVFNAKQPVTGCLLP